jgi:hypothetical protein
VNTTPCANPLLLTFVHDLDVVQLHSELALLFGWICSSLVFSHVFTLIISLSPLLPHTQHSMLSSTICDDIRRNPVLFEQEVYDDEDDENYDRRGFDECTSPEMGVGARTWAQFRRGFPAAHRVLVFASAGAEIQRVAAAAAAAAAAAGADGAAMSVDGADGDAAVPTTMGGVYRRLASHLEGLRGEDREAFLQQYCERDDEAAAGAGAAADVGTSCWQELLAATSAEGKAKREAHKAKMAKAALCSARWKELQDELTKDTGLVLQALGNVPWKGEDSSLKVFVYFVYLCVAFISTIPLIMFFLTFR